MSEPHSPKAGSGSSTPLRFPRRPNQLLALDAIARGRLGAYEILPIAREMRELLRTQAKTELLLEAATARGFTTLFEHGLRLCARGLTTPFEVQRVLAPDR